MAVQQARLQALARLMRAPQDGTTLYRILSR